MKPKLLGAGLGACLFAMACYVELMANMVSGWNVVKDVCVSTKPVPGVHLPEIIVAKLPAVPPLVIGCELPGCGPGSEGAGPIDVRVALSGNFAQGVVVSFENLSSTAADALQLRGNVKRSIDQQGRGALLFTVGRSVIRGVVSDPPTGDKVENEGSDGEGPSMTKVKIPPVALIEVRLAKDAVNDAVARVRHGDFMGRELIGELTFTFEYFRGSVLVGGFWYKVRFKWCGETEQAAGEDEIEVTHNSENDSAVILLTGRRDGGWLREGPHRTSDKKSVQNLLQDDDPNSLPQSEAVVFALGKAMRFRGPVSEWTDATGDRVVVPLEQAKLQVPVKIWIIGPQQLCSTEDSTIVCLDTKDVAMAHVELANSFYGQSRCGIAFAAEVGQIDPGELREALRNHDEFELPSCDPIGPDGTTLPDDTTLPVLVTTTYSQWYDPLSLNVYYVPAHKFGHRGERCALYPDIILVNATIATDATLAHEFGHALSLNHVNRMEVGENLGGLDYVEPLGEPDFGSTNLMWTFGVGDPIVSREELSIGQCFRCNANYRQDIGGTFIQERSIPGRAIVRPERVCPDDSQTGDLACPALNATAD